MGWEWLIFPRHFTTSLALNIMCCTLPCIPPYIIFVGIKIPAKNSGMGVLEEGWLKRITNHGIFDALFEKFL